MDDWASAAFVLRHGCPGKDIALATQLIGDFAFEGRSWDQAFSSNLSERQVLRAVRWLCGRGIFDSWIHCFCAHCTHRASDRHRHTYMDLAAERGLLPVVRFLHEHGKGGFTSIGVTGAAANGHVKVIKFLMQTLGDSNERASDAVARAVENGHLEIVRCLLECGLSIGRDAPTQAAKGGHLRLIEYLWDQDKDQVDQRCEWDSIIPKAAAASGHFHVVKWLYEHTQLRCNLTSFPAAARHGNVQLIQLLLDHCQPPASSFMIQTMTAQAADGNHLELMRYLETLGGDLMTTRAMDGAARHGNLEFLRHLYTHSTQGCTTHAMDGAAENGHLDIVQFLHEHRSEGCTPCAIELAARNGHLHVVKYLHKVVGVRLSIDAVGHAVRGNQLEVIKYFHSNGAIRANRRHAITCIDKGFLAVLKYLCANELTTLRAEDLKQSSVSQEDHVREFVVEYLVGRRTIDQDIELKLHLAEVLTRMVKRGKLHQIQFLDSRYDSSQVNCAEPINAAATDGRLDMLQHFHSKGYQGFTDSMRYAVTHGHLSCVQFLYETCGIPCPPDAIDIAVGHGRIELVKYLHSRCGALATAKAMDTAARLGELAIVQFLHEQCPVEAMEAAATMRHLAVAEYLRFYAQATRTYPAMDRAALNGHLAVVRSLRERLRED